jgi:AraC family transcriptional regulator
VYKGGLSRLQLNRVFEYIEEHLAESIGLSDLADTAGLSIYHFARQFRQSTAVAPHRYVLQRKIDRAKEALRDPRKSILEASALVGFEDQSHFTKTFRRLVGITPTEFRSRI